MTNDERNPNDEVLLKIPPGSLPFVILSSFAIGASSFSSALFVSIRAIRWLV
jgi:hypothetical protein